MATLNQFESWAEYMAEGANLASDQFTVALTNTAPVATNSVLADITQISYTNCSSRNLTTTSSTQTGGVYSLVLADLTLEASGGDVGPFRYVVIYDSTVSGSPLLGWVEYGSALTMADTETLLLDFSSSTVVIN